MPDLLPPLRYDRGPTFPTGLFERRTRAVFPKVAEGWPEVGRIGLPISKEYKAAALASGARQEDFGRLSIERRQAILPTMQGFVPFVAQKQISPLRIEMIPTTSFGASLKNLLTPNGWKGVRSKVYSTASHICQVCGTAHGPVECHEVWEYHTPPNEETWGVQTLKAMLCLCADCHEMFHPGLANLRGRSEEVAARTCTVNCWTPQEHRQFLKWSNALHAYRSRFDWLLDISEFPTLGMLEIDPRWSVDEERQCLTTENGKLGTVRTALLGIQWALDDAGYEALDAQSYRDETKRAPRKSA